MAIGLDPKQSLSPGQLITSLLVSHDGRCSFAYRKGIFTEEEFLKMVNLVNVEILGML